MTRKSEHVQDIYKFVWGKGVFMPQGWRRTSGFPVLSLCLIPWDKVSLSWTSAGSQQSPGILLSPPPDSGVVAVCMAVVALGTQLWSLCARSKHSSLSHLSNPHIFLKCFCSIVSWICECRDHGQREAFTDSLVWRSNLNVACPIMT